MQRRIIYFLTITTLFFGANLLTEYIASQTKPFTMRQILNAVASVKEGRITKSKIISDIRQRGVDFPLTKENEKLIRDEGASDEIIGAIREQNSKFASTFVESGDAHAEKKEYDQAIKDYTTAIELKPDYELAYYKRAIAYKEKGEYDQAIKDYTAAIRLNPKDWNYYFERALIYFYRIEDYDKAISDMDKAIGIRSDISTFYELRAESYEKKGNYDLAIADFRKTLELNPNRQEAKDGLARVLKKKQEKD